MAILTAKYTSAQASTDGLNTTPPVLNDAMGIVGSDPANRVSTVSNYITSTYPNFSTTVSPTQVVVSFSANINPEIFNGNFTTSFTSNNVSTLFNQISGTITGFTSGSHLGLNDRYAVSGISIDAHTYFNNATWANVLTGGDTLIGGLGNDVLQDYGVNNTFKGMGGNDTFIAAAGGVNTAIFTGKSSDYAIQSSSRIEHDGLIGLSGYTVNDNITKRDGFTQLINVNRLSFTDTNVALDIGPTQTAGSVYMLYQATFNRTPDAAGLGYWIAQVDKGANIITTVAATFVTSPEFVAKYGTNPSNASYVDNLYQNVLHRSGDAGGIAYWNGQLNTGAATKAFVLEQFATLAEGAALVAPTISHGIAYQQWVG